MNELQYELKKSLWTEEDFENMGWHDAMIYAFSLQVNPDTGLGELLLDIDYIFQWIKPVPPAEHFTFFVAPCTLVFKEATNLVIDIETGRLASLELEIADLNLLETLTFEHGYKTLRWNLETQRGDVNFEAVGFEQFVRMNPKHIQRQQLTLEERGGISFAKISV